RPGVARRVIGPADVQAVERQWVYLDETLQLTHQPPGRRLELLVQEEEDALAPERLEVATRERRVIVAREVVVRAGVRPIGRQRAVALSVEGDRLLERERLEPVLAAPQIVRVGPRDWLSEDEDHPRVRQVGADQLARRVRLEVVAGLLA